MGKRERIQADLPTVQALGSIFFPQALPKILQGQMLIPLLVYSWLISVLFCFGISSPQVIPFRTAYPHIKKTHPTFADFYPAVFHLLEER